MEILSKSKKSLFTGLSQKKIRLSNNAFAAEGIRTIDELIRQGQKPIWIAGSQKWEEYLLAKVQQGISCHILSQSMADTCSFLKTPPGLIAVFPMPAIMSPTEVINDFPKNLVVANGIKDAGNLGTLIRTMHWFGWERLWLSAETTDPFNPKAIQAAMGSTAALSIISGTATELAECLKAWKMPAFVLSLQGEETLPDKLPACLILGSESHGTSPEWEQLGRSIRLPSSAQSPPDSLNVTISFAALAGAISLNKNSRSV